MNIFWLDDDPEVCATMHCDKHIVKMCTEYAQILCTVIQVYGLKTLQPGLFKPTHLYHPCVKWAAESNANFKALEALFLACCQEYTRRYARVHKSQRVWFTMVNLRRTGLPKHLPQTPVPLCMPDKYHRSTVIASYRAFYNGSKSRFAVWKYSPKPKWFRNLYKE